MTVSIWYPLAWLALGLIGDLLCEAHSRKLGEPYRKGTQIACYVAGPIILPWALIWASGQIVMGRKGK